METTTNGREIAVVDADDEPRNGGSSTAIVHRSSTVLTRGAPGMGGLLKPAAPPSEVLAAQNETRALIQETLEPGRDFGHIPGTDKKKKVLLKAGAERVNAAFAVYPEFEIMEHEIDHDREVKWSKRKKIWENGQFVGWDETSGVSVGLYRYSMKCYLIHRESGAIIATGVGSCSSMEDKYIENPRNIENTVLKMGKKRAYVDATLTAYGLSDEFTQDVDEGENGGSERSHGAPKSNEPAAQCPKCGGAMWDNRENKTNPKAPDFACKDKVCAKAGGVFWPGQWPPKIVAVANDEQRARLVEAIAALADPEIELGKRDGNAVAKANALVNEEGAPEEKVVNATAHLTSILRKFKPEDAPTPWEEQAAEDAAGLPFAEAGAGTDRIPGSDDS